MRFSIIVPIYNSERYLDACVASVLGQSASDWELLLIDDGSTDTSGDMIDAYAARDTRIRALHQENRGQFFARQAGISESRGRYLLFLDSDDRFEANCLSVLSDVIEREDPDIIAFAGRIFEDSRDTGRVFGRVSQCAQPLPRERLCKSLLSSHTLNSIFLKAIRRELFSGDTSDYSAFSGACCGEDKVRLLYPVSKADTIIAIPDELYRYYRRSDSVMHDISFATAERMLSNDMFGMVRRFLPVWDMDTQENRDLLDAYYIRNYLSVYFGLRKRAQTLSLRRQLRRCAWKEMLYLPAFNRRAVRHLSARDRLRLLVAQLRL